MQISSLPRKAIAMNRSLSLYVMGKRRIATLVIVAGGVGLLVGSFLLAKFPGSDTFDRDSAIPLVWTKDGDFHLSLGLSLILLGLAAWHFLRFGLGKLVVVGLLAAGALLFSLGDFGTGEAVWSSDEYSGDELVGIWLFISSAAVVLIGVVWSSFSERPAGVTFGSYFFSEGPAGGTAEPAGRGIIVDEGQSPPEEWWLASDGEWYPPEQHADYVPPPPGPELPRRLWFRRRWVIVVSVVVGSWSLGQIFAGGEEVPLAGSDESGEDDRGPVADQEWTIALNEQSGGIYTLVMIKTFSPLEEADIEDLGGRLVWEETEIELCRIGIRSVGDGFVQVGDIFQTVEGCDGDTGMQQALDEFGPPDTACVYVQVGGVDDEYCAPLTVGIAETESES